MNNIQEKVSEIRTYINHPWKNAMLFAKRQTWRMLCASMDVIEDTQQGIDDFFLLPDFSASHGGYLHLYGLLQLFFTQQDATSNLNRVLVGSEINWRNHSDIFYIRELRNDAIGHPTSRGKDESFHFITRISINKESFEITSFGKEHNDTNSRIIKLQVLKQSQEHSIESLLNNILKHLNTELMDHRKKFKDEKLLSLIPETYGYHLGKVYEGIYSDYPLASMNLDQIKNICMVVKEGISSRFGGIDVLESTKHLTDKVEYVLDKLSTFSTNSNFYQNRDAEIFLDAFNGYFEKFKSIIVEIDEEFAMS